jgi:transposase
MTGDMSVRAIAAKLCAAGFRVSKTTVHRKLADLRQQAGVTISTNLCRPRKLTARSKRWLCRQIRVSNVRTTSALHQSLIQHGLSICHKTVLRGLKSIKSLRYVRPKRCIPLTVRHKTQRLQFARECLASKFDWSKALFADEKVWYLDGPSVRSKLWQDARDPPVRLPRTGERNRSVYIWGGISRDFVPELTCVPSKFNAQGYCDILADALLPYPTIHQYTLVHDRDSVHTAKYTESWLQAHHIHSKLLPPKGADMNPLENVWAIVSAKVFPQNKTYTSTEALVKCVCAAWREIQTDRALRHALINSMPNRLALVVAKKGALTKY